MLMTLAAGVLAALTFGPQPDQTIAVQRGARLDVNNFAGEIVIHAWDRDAVKVAADPGENIDIQNTGSVVRIRGRARRTPRSIDFQISVPAWMPLNLSGVNTDVAVDGVQSEVTVETVGGDVKVRGGSGFISLRSVQGEVALEKARASRVEVNSVNQGIRLADVTGDIAVETVNGEITLDHIDSASVEASTVNGEVSYDGTIKDRGHYRFTSHNGDLIITVPEKVSAIVSVSTFNGEFEADFPVTLTETRRGKRFNFTLGSGSARIDLESFGGTIRLRHPGAPKRSKKDQ